MTVPASKRRTSPLEWQTLATDIRIEVIRLMGSDKIVPKSMRFTLAMPTVKDAHALVRSVIHARDTYPTDRPSWEKRRRHLTDAIGWCDVLEDDIALIKAIWDQTDLNRFGRLTTRLEREKQLLRGRIQADRNALKTKGVPTDLVDGQ